MPRVRKYERVGRPSDPYTSRRVWLPDLGEPGRQFIAAYKEAMGAAARAAARWKADETREPTEWEDASVYLFRLPESEGGGWVVTEKPTFPDELHERTDGILVVFADGDIGIER